ncbi:MAG: DNA polymerase III subunit delta, partial [Pseudomonadota bacterium]
MKIQGRAAIGYCEKPDPQYAGFLLHGPDAALTAERRAALVASLSGGDSLRVERADPAAVRKDQALLHDA